jgi:RNA polymerase sigma factor (sigma-70 family)|tara:strand:+ start:1366 stop:2133 length:768 start_codon:yes stop_codon:yes gene_type:complete
MKKYNIDNYVKYKRDIELQTQKLEDVVDGDYTIYNRNEMIICFTPLVENLARKFSTSQQASGVMTILDLIQEGNAGLTQAVDRLDYKTLMESEDQEKTLKSFLSKRIKGAIRRGIDQNRGDIRIPEHKMNEIRRNFGRDKKMVEMFFNSIFLSIDDKPNNNEDMVYQIPDKSEPYNMDLLNAYLDGLLRKHLDDKEYQVLRLSYGLGCDKYSAKDIAKQLDMQGSSSYVRVSQLKKQAVQKLIDNVDYTQVLDYL